jgi:hypothetical protein
MAGNYVETKVAIGRGLIAVRFDENEEALVSAADLARQASGGQLHALSWADKSSAPGDLQVSGNRDGWVSEDEVLRVEGLNPGSRFSHEVMVQLARAQAFPGTTIAELRLQPPVSSSPPPPKASSLLPERKELLPLADYFAHRLAAGTSFYAQSLGVMQDYFEATEEVRNYSLDEIAGALAILMVRNGDEFALSKKSAPGGDQYFIVHGKKAGVELNEDDTGLDLLFHTHPGRGVMAAGPSTGDEWAARAFDPDRKIAAVTQDGWWNTYEAIPGQGGIVGDARRIWK